MGKNQKLSEGDETFILAVLYYYLTKYPKESRNPYY